MYVRTIILNYCGQESKKQFAVYDSDTPVTLKHGQCHQTWYKLVDLKIIQSLKKKTCLNSVCEKPTIKFLSNQETQQLSPVNMCQCQKQNTDHYIDWHFHAKSKNPQILG